MVHPRSSVRFVSVRVVVVKCRKSPSVRSVDVERKEEILRKEMGEWAGINAMQG